MTGPTYEGAITIEWGGRKFYRWRGRGAYQAMWSELARIWPEVRLLLQDDDTLVIEGAGANERLEVPRGQGLVRDFDRLSVMTEEQFIRMSA